PLHKLNQLSINMKQRLSARIAHGALRTLGLDKLFQQKISAEFYKLLLLRTNNFGGLTWLGKPIWQSPLDLWTIQETIWTVQPDLLIECGTNRGGSAYFYAQLFDLMGKG